MIGKIIEFSVKNKFLVILFTAVVVFGGLYAIYTIRLDAIPDLSDVQVIVFTEYPGQAPRVVEDQVTYPLTTTMLAVPYAKVVRGYSMFGYSFIYIIFEDGTDLYWARSRVLEYLSLVAASCRRASRRGWVRTPRASAGFTSIRCPPASTAPIIRGRLPRSCRPTVGMPRRPTPRRRTGSGWSWCRHFPTPGKCPVSAANRWSAPSTIWRSCGASRTGISATN